MLNETQLEKLEQLLYEKAMEGDVRIGLQLLKVTRVAAAPERREPEPGIVDLPPILEDPEGDDW